MNESIFRKKSLDKVKSPESLNDYVQVSNPGVWLILAAVIVLLVGACVWGIFGRIETKLAVTAQAENGTLVCEVGEEQIASVQTGMEVRVGTARGKVLSVDAETGTAQVQLPVSDGVYAAEIVTESLKPFSFVFN